MARTNINGDAEDTIFRIFDHSQGLQRRAFRILARRHFNIFGIDELRSQARGLLDEIERLAKMAADENSA